MPENTEVPEGSCSLRREAHTGAAFLAGAVARGVPTLEQSTCQGLHPREKAHARAVLEELQSM